MQNTYHTTLSKNGRIVLPAEYRAEHDLKPGDRLILRREDGALRITTLMTEVKKMQKMAKTLVPAGVSLVDELLQERRDNAKKEHGDL